MLNYFPPKSIINWCQPRKHRNRYGHFIINTLQGNSLGIDTTYYAFTAFEDGFYGRLSTCQEWGESEPRFKITSSKFNSEEEVVQWLDAELMKIITVSIKKYNDHLQ